MKQMTSKRPLEIVKAFNALLDQSIQDLLDGKSDRYLEINEIAEQLFIDPRHLSNTIKQVTGQSPCDICNEKTLKVAKKLLANPTISITQIANILTFEPTNFTKYFKKHTGMTPSSFRNECIILKPSP